MADLLEPGFTMVVYIVDHYIFLEVSIYIYMSCFFRSHETQIVGRVV